jgi:hypothetical protein
MMGITLKIAGEQLEIWLEASREVAVSQSYRIGSRQYTRADAGVIQKQIQYWQRQVTQLSRKGRKRFVRGVPGDN